MSRELLPSVGLVDSGNYWNSHDPDKTRIDTESMQDKLESQGPCRIWCNSFRQLRVIYGGRRQRT